MTLNINWSVYSAQQIVEFKNNGVNVPDDIYNEAFAEVNQESSDSTTLEYEIVDNSSDNNEAAEFVQNFKNEHKNKLKNLRNLARQLTEKCNTFQEVANKSYNSVGELEEYVDQQAQMANVLNQNLAESVEDMSQIAEEKQAKIERLKAKIAALEEKAEAGTLTPFEQSEYEALVGLLESSADSANSEINDKKGEVSTKEEAVNSVVSDVQVTSKTLSELVTKSSEQLKWASKAVEVGTQVYNKGVKRGKIGSAVLGAGVGLFANNATKAVAKNIKGNVSDAYAEKMGYENVNGQYYDPVTKTFISETQLEKASGAKSKSNWAAIGTAFSPITLGGVIGGLFGRKARRDGEAAIKAGQLLQGSATAVTLGSNNLADSAKAEFTNVLGQTEQFVAIGNEISEVEIPELPQTIENVGGSDSIDDTKEDEEKKKNPFNFI